MDLLSHLEITFPMMVGMAECSNRLETLLQRIRSGDESALDELVREYEPRVRLAARTLLGPAMRSQLDSIDIAQSVHRTLLSGMKNAEFTFQTPEQLMALLLTMVRRKVARQWRRMQRQTSADAAEDSRSQLLDLLEANLPDPAQAAQLHDAIDQALAGLSEVDRTLLEMRLQGYRTSEVAERLGMDARVLRARLSRLRQHLQKRGLLADWI
ncbi:MAG: hypothetical protein KatS3mg105_1928 [Gemmatales bacterium]|nr:MAG: hypothetical protein KatS3mg105_1928 [Gemmatales bacterium]